MKYIKTTLLGALTIVILLFISEYTGSLVAPYSNKIETQLDNVLIGVIVILISICIIVICYLFGQMIKEVINLKKLLS